MRVAAILKMLIVLGVASRLRHDFHGPPFDYFGLAAACAASWIGIPGPGEPVLIAAGVIAAHHKLPIGPVVFVAFISATAGGIAGWLIGMKAGRKVLSAPGPLHRARRSALAKGDEVFNRYAVYAIFLTPSWVAGIHRVRTGIYLPVNAGAAALWAAGIGFGAYLIGPSVIEFVEDLGLVTGIALAVLVAVVVAAAVGERRRRRSRRSGPEHQN